MSKIYSLLQNTQCSYPVSIFQVYLKTIAEMEKKFKTYIRQFLEHLSHLHFKRMNIFSHDPNNRFCALNVVQYISVGFSLSVPGLYNYKGLPGMYLVYSFLLCIFLIIIFILAVIEDIFWRVHKLSLDVLLMEVFSLTFITCVNVASILDIIFKRKQLLLVTQILQRVENRFIEVTMVSSHQCQFF